MRHRHIAQAAALMLAAVLLAALPGCARSEETQRLALILSGAEGHHWENILDGARAAANRMQVELYPYTPDEEAGLTLEALPGLALRQGADALIAATQGEEELLAALEATGLPVVAVGAAFDRPQPVATVLNDDAKMGENAAKALNGTLEAGDSVLLLTDSAEFRESDQREAALRGALEEHGVTICGRIYTGDRQEWAYRQALQQLYLQPDLDAIVAFSARSTVGAAQAVQYLQRDVAIVGTDVVPELIECLQDGSVSATIVRNSFGMGFLGVEYAVHALRGETAPERQTLASVAVTPDNLFTPEIEKIVFPYE